MKIGFVLAAGFGKRMGDLTADTPKPLLPVGGVPLIYYSLFQLVRAGVQACVVNTHYLARQIETELKSFPFFEIFFSRESEAILGTAGGLRHALPLLERAARDAGSRDTSLLLLNPDTIFFPETADHPRTNWLDEAETCLCLKPKPTGSKEVGWEFLEPDTARKRQEDSFAIESHPTGAFYYIGYSLLDWRCVAHLPDDTYAELGPIWKEMAAGGRLAGREFRGKVVDAGTRAAYDSLQGREIVPSDLKEEWSRFLNRL